MGKKGYVDDHDDPDCDVDSDAVCGDCGDDGRADAYVDVHAVSYARISAILGCHRCWHPLLVDSECIQRGPALPLPALLIPR